MLKTLIKKQLLELFQTYFIDKKTGKAKSRRKTVYGFLLFACLFLSLGLAFYSMASGLSVSVLGNGFNWLYFALMGLLSIALGVFGSVFNTYASLYLPKDNEFLLSLPIPPRTLLLSRMVGVYVISLMYSAWIWIPALIAYWISVPITVTNVLFPVLLTFVIALFVSLLSSILGWVVALIAQKAKGKSILTVIISLTIMGLYYVVYFKIVNALGEISAHLGELSSTVQSWLHYIYLLGSAADGNISAMLLFSLITIALASICIFVLSRSFMKFAIPSSSNTVNRAVAEKDYLLKKPFAALLSKEFRQFTSIPTWMLNGGFGLLIMVLGAGAVIVKSSTIRESITMISLEMPELAAALPAIVLAAICLVISTNSITPVSVSIEGKSLWILQSLPVDTWNIIKAKEQMDVRLEIIPALLLTISICAVAGFSIPDILLILFGIVTYIWLSADLGLFLNLKSPNFTWTNIASLTKQSMPVVVGLFGGWGFCVLIGFASAYLANMMNISTVLVCIDVLFLIFLFILRSWLKKKGTAILKSL